MPEGKFIVNVRQHLYAKLFLSRVQSKNKNKFKKYIYSLGRTEALFSSYSYTSKFTLEL